MELDRYWTRYQQTEEGCLKLSDGEMTKEELYRKTYDYVYDNVGEEFEDNFEIDLSYIPLYGVLNSAVLVLLRKIDFYNTMYFFDHIEKLTRAEKILFEELRQKSSSAELPVWYYLNIDYMVELLNIPIETLKNSFDFFMEKDILIKKVNEKGLEEYRLNRSNMPR